MSSVVTSDTGKWKRTESSLFKSYVMGAISEKFYLPPQTIFYLPGTGLSLAAGAVFGWTFGQEFANHYLQLYRMDTLAAQSKFMEWWEAKCAERS